jgi:hypothetical protein
MTASTIAAVVVSAGLGLVALALGLLARRYSGHALAIGLIGLLGLTTATTWIISTALDSAGQNKELLSLREQARALERQLEKAKAELGKAQQEAATANAEVEALRVELQDQRADRGKSQQEAEKSKAAAERLREDLQEERAKVAMLEKKLLLAQQTRSSTPQSAPSVVDSGDLRRRLDNRIDTPFYTLQPMEQRALVAGLTGSWYVVRPKLAGKPIVFADGQFRLPGAVQELTSSELQLQRDLLAPIQKAAKSTRLFLRGAADYRRLLGAPKELDARKLNILPLLPDGTYGAVPRRLPQSAHVRNQDLPNLRADWLSQHIRSVLPAEFSNVIILENPPATGLERTVDIIVYVEW